MVRIIIKGGVWKEDEVLKAAIAKYGKNQWARISSLLVRKTPKQCKARWYEWLDPSIKKTEWSKEEDEKVLHLAKLMPTQWRTIAPIVGRTATQCLERYQKLLDVAEAKENEELGLAGPSDTGPGADDVRRLRPGEIDPDPETKPARPDPIDMDEDEKEMLSEARARLANTQGKKAKRKARERQLEEARRLAVLQKKRELKAAGIIMRHKTKKKGMDYNADIPFEKKPAAGFYDTAEEQARVEAAPVGQTLRRLENKRKPEEEEAERKKRAKRGKEGENGPHQTKFVAARDAQIQKLKEAESIGRRGKLELPAAQVSDVELEEIVKIGQAGENAKALVGGTDDSSEQLLAGYDNLERARMARTPRTAPQQDNVLLEARNLRNLTIAQTPLLGDENTPLHVPDNGGTGFEGATPRHQVAFTPNPLATPRATDGPSVTPFRTPMRDNLSINPEGGSSFVGQTPRELRMRTDTAKRSLQASFKSLPKPENNFELPHAESGKVLSVEDAAEQEEERAALARRSQVVRRALPRPPNVDLEHLVPAAETEQQEVQRLVDFELVRLMHHDALAHPIPGTAHPGGTPSTYEPPPDTYVAVAKAAIHRELAGALGFPEAPEEQVRDAVRALSVDDDAAVVDERASWVHLRATLLPDTASGSWVPAEHLDAAARAAGYKAVMEERKTAVGREAARAAKVEKKLGVVLGGYATRAAELGKRLGSAGDAIQDMTFEFESFGRLQGDREEVDKLEARERALQSLYAELEKEKSEAESRVAALEERVMEEAEKLNEAALLSD
ncbi:pre-mRNA splicing factor component-domain-containing protein [Lactarius sanguifluus]|nr:pre-mRNA splicing factor component-domain-containing protein [Lactarius sanguifluus]